MSSISGASGLSFERLGSAEAIAKVHDLSRSGHMVIGIEVFTQSGSTVVPDTDQIYDWSDAGDETCGALTARALQVLDQLRPNECAALVFRKM